MVRDPIPCDLSRNRTTGCARHAHGDAATRLGNSDDDHVLGYLAGS
jgi:hypothetical protein